MRPGNWGFGSRLAAVTAILTILYALTAAAAYGYQGGPGLLAAGVPAAVCLVGAIAALAVSYSVRGPNRAVLGLVLPMAIRTGLPLVLAVAMRLVDGPLVKAGGVYYLLSFYLVALAVEMPLSLGSVKPAGAEQDARSASESPSPSGSDQRSVGTRDEGR